eukprot:TRINITY_DN2202_c0_g2_i1.p1 TRINITY_DN2202_c0_g2~~TRINITY_DN2202_c0_g2_i1.p1  ORF type:complete len:380 (-),score=63.60 TRINITY_DN2202_c0_g2_i1:17-1156(-)
MDSSPAGISTVIPQKLNQFGAEVLDKLCYGSTSNVFVSGLSISQALCCVLNGSSDTNKKEMLKALHLDSFSDQERNDFFQAVNNFLSISKQADVSIANSVWVDPKYALTPEFRKVSLDYYATQTASLGGAKEINQWVNAATRGKIPKLVDELPRDTKLVLLNAIFFKGLFKTPFEPSETRSKEFRGRQRAFDVQMMHRENTTNYLETSSFQAVQLAYKYDSKGPEFSTLVVLPLDESPQGMMKLIGELRSNPAIFEGRFKQERVELSLPKFTIEFETELNESLGKLGITEAFGSGGNGKPFERLTTPGDLIVTKVIHKTFLEVDEKGATAAAVTAVMGAKGGVATVPQKKIMVVDRPFLFFIRESKTGVHLFAGAINQL